MQKVPGVCLCCVNAKHGLGSFKVWSRGTIFPERRETEGKCYDCMAETLNVYFNSFLCLRKSLSSHQGKSFKVLSGIFKEPRLSRIFARPFLVSDPSMGQGGTQAKTEKHFLFIPILEESREATLWNPKLSSSTPSPGGAAFNPFLLNSTSSIQMSVIITAAQQTLSLNYNILPAPCAKSTSLSLSFHTSSPNSQLLNTLLFFLCTHCATQFISATHRYSKGSVRGGGDSRRAEVWMGGSELSAIVSHQSTPWGFTRRGKGREGERNVSAWAL